MTHRYTGTGLATPEQARHKAQSMIQDYYNFQERYSSKPLSTLAAQNMIQDYYNFQERYSSKPLSTLAHKKFRVRYVARISMWVVEYGHTYMAQRQTWQEAMNFVSYQTGRYRRVEAI